MHERIAYMPHVASIVTAKTTVVGLHFPDAQRYVMLVLMSSTGYVVKTIGHRDRGKEEEGLDSRFAILVNSLSRSAGACQPSGMEGFSRFFSAKLAEQRRVRKK